MADQLLISQIAAEAEYTDSAPGVVLSQVAAETEYDDMAPAIVASQVACEVEYDDTAPGLLITQLACEVEYVEGTPPPDAGFMSGSPDIPVAMATISTAFGTFRRATTFYVDTSGRAYLPGLIFPVVSGELRSVFSGVEASNSLTLQFELSGGGLPSDVSLKEMAETNDFRGAWISVYTFDPVTGENIDGSVWYSGKIDSLEWDDTYIWFSTRVGGDESFEKMLPPDVVTAERFYPSALDIGAAINMVFGTCRGIPCPNIRNDLEEDEYWYLLGYSGIEQVHEVRRDGWIVNSSEYELVHGFYYDWLRFRVEQRGRLTSERMTITATATGFKPRYRLLLTINNNTHFFTESTDPPATHVLDVYRFMLIHPNSIHDTMGVNEESFAVAKEALGDADELWQMSINIGGSQRMARDWLNDLLSYMPFHPYRDYQGKWAIFVDSVGPKDVSYYFGHRDDFLHNAIVTKRRIVASSQSIKKIRMSYNFNEPSLDKYGQQVRGAYHYEIEASTGKTTGIIKEIQLLAVNHTPTAKKMLSLVAESESLSDRYADIECGPDLKNAVEGDVLRGYTSYPDAYRDYVIIKQKKDISGEFVFECREYDADVFGTITIDDPVEPVEQTITVSGPDAIPYTYVHTDGSKQSIELTTAEIARYVFGSTYNGIIPAASWVLCRHKFAQTVSFPAGLVGSEIYVDPIATGSAATSESTLTIKKWTASTSSVAEIGTAVFDAAGMVSEITFPTAQKCLSGDIFYLIAPETPDATLGDISYTFVGVKEKVGG